MIKIKNGDLPAFGRFLLDFELFGLGGCAFCGLLTNDEAVEAELQFTRAELRSLWAAAELFDMALLW